jgi:purine-binding chemotaxis protein CheW
MSEVKNRIEDDDLFLIDDDEDTLADKYLSFKLGMESYGIDIKNILEIVELQKIIEIPDMPDYIKGVMNLRGKVIPVMDLRKRFSLEDRIYDDRNCIIIVKISNVSVGMIVDNVDEVLEIPQENIEPPPRFKSKSGENKKFINGLGKVGEDVKILLNVEKILYEKEIEELSEILEKS